MTIRANYYRRLIIDRESVIIYLFFDSKRENFVQNQSITKIVIELKQKLYKNWKEKDVKTITATVISELMHECLPIVKHSIQNRTPEILYMPLNFIIPL